MPVRPRQHPDPDPVAVVNGINAEAIRAELAELERRADALRVLLRASRARDAARRRRGEAAHA
jgi:hypothetical protein